MRQNLTALSKLKFALERFTQKFLLYLPKVITTYFLRNFFVDKGQVCKFIEDRQTGTQLQATHSIYLVSGHGQIRPTYSTILVYDVQKHTNISKILWSFGDFPTYKSKVRAYINKSQFEHILILAIALHFGKSPISVLKQFKVRKNINLSKVHISIKVPIYYFKKFSTPCKKNLN